jgi:hypothetical protein
MTKLITILLSAAALIVPTAALARHSADALPAKGPQAAVFAVGTGTATSGTFKSRTLGTGTYTATITPNGTAKTRKRATCTHAAGTITLTSTGSSAGTLTGTVDGRLCTRTAPDAKLKAAFFGKLTVTSATGTAASAAGAKGFVGYTTRAKTHVLVAAGKAAVRQALRHGFR